MLSGVALPFESEGDRGRPSRSKSRPRSRRRTCPARGRSCSVHGLWLLPTSWDRWAKVFEGEGFAALSSGWPDDPDTVAEAREHPEVMAKKSIKDVADHDDQVIQELKKKPAVVGHSFGGLMTEILAGRGLSK